MSIHEFRPKPHPPIGIPTIIVGKYRIATPSDDAKIYIGHECGEGGTFPLAEFEAVVGAFFKEHF